jgi:hypothetical protein
VEPRHRRKKSHREEETHRRKKTHIEETHVERWEGRRLREEETHVEHREGHDRTRKLKLMRASHLQIIMTQT